MRLFIAIQLSEEMRKALVDCLHDLKKQGVEGNYVPAQNLHLTLAFIGEYRDPEQVRKRKFRKHSMGRSKGKSETENLCQRSAGGSEECRHSL